MRDALGQVIKSLWVRRTKPASESKLRSNLAVPPQHLNRLESIATAQRKNLFVKWWHYFEIYDNLLGKIAEESRESTSGEPLKILEIGVFKGGSLQLWREYFGPRAVIFGIDVDENCATLGVSEAEIRIGSQSDPSFLAQVVQEMGGLDIVIDDGSHISSDVIFSLGFLFPYLSDGGHYIVEDLHTSYWPKWGGGLRRKTSSIEALKSVIDMLHHPYFFARPRKRRLRIDEQSIESIHFHDSVAVLRKRSSRAPALFFSQEANP